MANRSTTQSFGFLGFLFREGSALAFAALLWYALWGGYAPNTGNPQQAFRSALIIGMIALTYVGLQAFTVVSNRSRGGTLYLMDLFFSLIPLAVVGSAIVLNVSGYLPLTFYQNGVVWLGGLASVIDVVFFTWFNMKLNKLKSNLAIIR